MTEAPESETADTGFVGETSSRRSTEASTILGLLFQCFVYGIEVLIISFSVSVTREQPETFFSETFDFPPFQKCVTYQLTSLMGKGKKFINDLLFLQAESEVLKAHLVREELAPAQPALVMKHEIQHTQPVCIHVKFIQ